MTLTKGLSNRKAIDATSINTPTENTGLCKVEVKLVKAT